MALQTYQSSITTDGTNGHRTNMLARRIAPSRDKTWLIQRVRMAALGGRYLYRSNIGSVAVGNTDSGAMPCCGLWRNRIAPETEIVFVGCVPPKMTAYDPQIPVTIRSNDFVVFGVMDPSISGAGTGVPVGVIFTVSIELDYEEINDSQSYT